MAECVIISHPIPRSKPIPMLSTVLMINPSRRVHDINVRSAKGRVFAIDICESAPGAYDSTVTVLDKVSNPPGSWLINTQPNTSSAKDNFKSALELIQKYLDTKDSAESIVDIHNPCNCPFISEDDQNLIAISLGFHKKVMVN